jgi:hypothetical protein
MDMRSLLPAVSLSILLTLRAEAVWLNEVQANPAGPEHQDEFVELVNPDSVWVQAAGLWLGDGSGEDQLVPWGAASTVLAPGGLALVLDPDHLGAYLGDLPADVVLLTVADRVLGSGGLSNSSVETITLRDAAGTILDRVDTRPGLPEAVSLERRWGGAPCDSCWEVSRRTGGSPGWPNSVLPRPGELDLAGWEAGGPVLRAAGGFQGQLVWTSGLEPCLDSLLQTIALEPGGVHLAGWPPLPLPGSNPVRLQARHTVGSQELIDTLLWRDPQPGEVFLEAVQPDGTDWIQVRVGACPVRLDGCRLLGRSFAWTLSGDVEAGGRWLAGSLDAACGDAPQEARSPALALSGGVELRGPGGTLLDAAQWPDPLEPRLPWRRLDPHRDGGDPANWVAAPGLEPGCRPPDWPTGRGGRAGWRLSAQVFGPLPAWDRPLVLEAPAGVESWDMELWSLRGALVARMTVRARRMVWSGLTDSGQAVEPGVMLLRMTADGREELQVLSIRP